MTESDFGTMTHERRPLWIVLEIDVEDDCPLTDIEDPVLDTDLQHMGGICRSEVVTGGQDVEVLHFEEPMGSECLADVFFEHDCVPQITGVDDGSLLVTIHPSDRADIPELLEGLEAVGYHAQLDRVVQIDEDMIGTSPVLCDFSLLTEKQQEALELAVRHGYYSQPRETTLSELASRLGIGKSAVSHRLQAAESKVIRNHVPQTDSLSATNG
ncbi:helix-turn-helix domain-containing protein [Halapricum desulfuricans]|uniref:Transcriptional regulator, contains HTH domain n=1 Tax=Halapricum desulfuricans TaxID=2841257 RepID=A0A897NIB1_9EURY|nr:helix-turn-helix domain-containing protein [Halapricum desulfuricans]QSG09201.1 Transcriptional regulator, contains HTH domain [Halapricum desulfuricans]QSG12071.1 Transcriptional regulator, contains HTH domain [Halapricum desulfuricans]